MIVSTTEDNTQWQSSSSITNAKRSWDGEYNTSLMINSPAKDWVITLGTEWYIPSTDECMILFQNRFHANNTLNNGGYSLLANEGNYWTSYEYESTSAQAMNFTTGYLNLVGKNQTWRVRGVKKF